MAKSPTGKYKSNKDKGKKVSRGQQRYALVSDVQQAQKDYEAQAQEEAKKAGSRSLWSTVGGLVGAGLGLMAAPMLIPVGATAATTGLITGLSVGATSYGTGKGFKGIAESAGQKRKDIKVDKFYSKAAEEATQTFKDYDKAIEKSLRTQALVSGALAGLSSSGVLKKGKEAITRGLKGTGKAASTFDTAVTASEIGGTGKDVAYLAKEGVAADAAQVVIDPGIQVNVTPGSAETVAVEKGIRSYNLADAYDPLGPLSDRSLFANVKQSLTMAAASKTLDYILGKTQPKGSQFGQMEEIDYPNYIT